MADASSMAFADLLRAQRQAAGLSQEQLAVRARLSRSGVSELERGLKARPHEYTVRRLADALGLTGDERAAFLAAARGRRSPAATTSGHGSARGDLPPLVGRTRELMLIERLLAGEDSPALLLTGEPGIGKSRLLAEAMVRAQAAGWRVVADGCTRRSGQEPFAPLVGALARAIKRAIGDSRQSALRRHLGGCGWLTRLLPELVEMRLAEAPGWTLPPEQERRLMFAAAARYLANAAGPAGTLLLLDDLQWAGEDALDLLGSLLRPEPERPLRLLGAYRDTEVEATHPLAVFAADLARGGLLEHVRLGPLAEGEARTLAAALLDDRPGASAAGEAERVARRAGGAPYFLVSCAREARERARDGGRDGGRDGATDDVAADAVPWGIQQSIRLRVAALTPLGRDAVRVAAVAGRVAPYALLADVLVGEGNAERPLLLALESSDRAGLLMGEDAGGGGAAVHRAMYQFAHDLVREAVLADLGPARRAALHLSVAEAIERQCASEEERGRCAAELADHYQEAGDAGRALPYLLLAGDRAASAFAYGEAASHYQSALELARAAGDTPREAAASERLGLALRFLSRYDEALDALVRAAEGYRLAGDADALARATAQIGWAHADQGTPHEGIARLQRAVGELDGRGASARELAGVCLVLAHLCLLTGRYPEQLAASARALELARRAGAEHLYRQAEHMRDLPRIHDGRREEAEALLERAADAKEEGDLEGLIGSLLINARVAETTGATALAARCIARALDIAERLGKPEPVAMCVSLRGGMEVTAGRWKDARVDLERACALTPGESEFYFTPFIRLYYGYLCLLEGRAEGVSRVEDAAALAERTGNVGALAFAQYVLAEWDLIEGRPRAARRRLEPLLEVEAQQPVPGIISAMYAWAQLDLGEGAAAAERIGRVVEAARFDLFMRVTALRVQGLVFTRQRRWAEARETIEGSILLARSLRYPSNEARGLYIAGRLHKEMGEPEMAGERFEQALAILDALGERLYRPHVERALAALGARLAAR